MIIRICFVACLNLLVFPTITQAVYPFLYPECATYHPQSKRYFISNEANGNIVQIDSVWDTTFFYTDLTETVGMTVLRDTLFVCAPPNVVGFDLITDQMVVNIPVPGSARLNDVCADSSGNLWVTDPQGAQVFKVNIQSQTSELVASGMTMSWVNGIFFDYNNNRLLTCYWVLNSPIRAIAPDDYSLSIVLYTGLDNLNGITDDSEGHFYISAWGTGPFENGEIYRYDDDFSTAPLLFSDGHNGAGDMCYNKETTVLVIPNVLNHTVDFILDPYADPDDDGVVNADDNCLYNYNPDQEESDGDRVGDACDVCPGYDDFADGDADGQPDACDNCPEIANPQQENNDGDELGDACDNDDDNDGILDDADNCPFIENPGQEDNDQDGIGDVCDGCDCGPVWGDVTGDDNINPMDVVYMVNYIYLTNDMRSQPPNCPYQAGDVNCDGNVNPLDMVHFVNYVYLDITPFPCAEACGLLRKIT